MQKKRNILPFLLNNKAVVLLIVICIIAVFFSSRFVSPQNLINVMRQVSASAILGVGFTMILAAGDIDLSVGSLIGLLGVLMALLSKVPNMPFVVVLFSGLLAGGAFGYFNGWMITTFKLPAFLVTLATGQIFKGMCSLSCNNTPVSSLPEQFKFFGQGNVLHIPVPVYILIFVGAIFAILLYRTQFGRHVIAIGSNASAANVCGISISKTKSINFMLMGMCSAIAALVLTGRAFSAQPTAGQGMEMDAIAAVVIGGTALNGGVGKIGGSIIGCFIVGVINNMLNLAGVDSNWQLIAKGAIILFAILIDSTTNSLEQINMKSR